MLQEAMTKVREVTYLDPTTGRWKTVTTKGKSCPVCGQDRCIKTVECKAAKKGVKRTYEV